MSYTVGDLVAEFLAACGVTTAFGIVSVHNIPILDAIGRRNAIRFIPVRGETGGGHMADAYARASGSLGVLITSTGPAAANAVPALVEAEFAGSPLLHITGQTATVFLDRKSGAVHDVPGQPAMLRAVGKALFRIEKADQALDVLSRAARAALSPRQGPVSVEIPIDLQRAEIARPAGLDELTIRVDPLQPSPAALDDMAELLRGARRPMLWLGNGARSAVDAARALVDLGFGAVTSWSGRGTIPEDHPRTLGAMNGNGSADVQAFYRTVDAMLVVGSSLRAYETNEFKLPLPDTLARVDIDPGVTERGYRCASFVAGDARLALEGLHDRLNGRLFVDPLFGDDIARTRRAAVEAYSSTLGPYRTFPEQLSGAIGHDTVFVRDATVAASTWGQRLVPLNRPENSIYPVGAAIGPGLPFGIGAALAAGPSGRKTVVLVGDGGFALGMAELWTAAQEAVDLCVIVMNDGQYSAIGFIQDAKTGGRRFYTELRGPDLQALAQLAGLRSWRVDRADRFGATLSEALATRGPTLVEVDMNAIGPVAAYGPWLTPP